MSMCFNFIWRQQLIGHRLWLQKAAYFGQYHQVHAFFFQGDTYTVHNCKYSLGFVFIQMSKVAWDLHVLSILLVHHKLQHSLFPVLNRGFILLVLKHVSNPRTTDHSIYWDSFLQRDVTMSHFWMEFSNALRYKNSPTPWSPLTLNYDKRKVTEFSLKQSSYCEGKSNFSAEFKKPRAADGLLLLAVSKCTV